MSDRPPRDAGGASRLRALLVDPSLFTQPYDAALDRGLASVGVDTCWAVRELRAHEAPDLEPDRVAPFFYPFSDGRRRRTGRLGKIVKGVEHALGLLRLVRLARRYDVVHVQWAMLPALDARAMRAIGRTRPVVLTVHDLQPFNGKSVSRLQTEGTDAVLRAADRLIVHTEQGADALVERGIDRSRIDVVPHGLLPLAPAATGDTAPSRAVSDRWHVMLFGRLQTYKGLDVLVEALGLLAPADRAGLRVSVVGTAMMDLAPIRARAAALGLDEGVFAIEDRYVADGDMAGLLGAADCFVFPYHAIEASGVLFLIAGLGKWIVASDLGAFRDLVGQAGGAGTLVPPGDPEALAAALVASIGRHPEPAAVAVPGWDVIGARTEAVYRRAIADRR